MAKVLTLMSTGIPELDETIQGVWPGDNIVWQMKSLDDYIAFVHPFCRDAYAKGAPLVYFRFAGHEPVIPPDVKVQEYLLHPEEGFESFLAEIFRVIEKNGPGAFYVFDCLSELSVDWYSDQMLANFFMLTCPYLYEYDTVAYFALLRNRHAATTVRAIHTTAQVVIDVHRDGKELYLQPLKVFKRHTKTMYTLHHWKGRRMEPVTKSTEISSLLKDIDHHRVFFSIDQTDMWNRIIARGNELQDAAEKGKKKDAEHEEYRQRLIRMLITRDPRLLKLAERYLDLPDLIDAAKHMIGTGLVGGKTAGMLLARAILKKENPRWQERLEPHDSFFIGSDVFYTYLIQSKCWWPRWKQRKAPDFLESADEAYGRMLQGVFPQEILDQFTEVLNYFGQSPIIVRSSSLLEDAYGNSFSGKYESVFCVNQGTPEERMAEFVKAVQTVYASTMSRDALQYRYHRGLLDQDEQMGLLVQRVSGSAYGDYFFPQIAGVGFSYNLYVWEKGIDPRAGVLRLVFGLGTRAVDRSDDDYTRVIAVNEPLKRPEGNIEEIRRFTQRKVDTLSLGQNRFESKYFSDLVKEAAGFNAELFASRDLEAEQSAADRGAASERWLLTFDRLLSGTGLIEDLGKILRILQDAYDYPVDIEFTANFESAEDFRVNLLQCRPYQVRRSAGVVKEPPAKVGKDDLILSTAGPVIGSSVHMRVDRLVYIVPEVYGRMAEQDRHAVARVIGRITNLGAGSERRVMLLGPGRWGTTTPALGVPVDFSAIKNVSVLCELAEMHEGLVPDVSLGTHFFNDLVELNILYLAIYPDRKDNVVHRGFLNSAASSLEKILPDAAPWSRVIRVIDLSDQPGGWDLFLNVNAVEQKAVCYKAIRSTDNE